MVTRWFKQGILRNGIVAVKRLRKIWTIKDSMFHREVISLISVKQQNIVRFIGYCSVTEEHATLLLGGRHVMADIRERLLCFEYIRNGSLENHLTGTLPHCSAHWKKPFGLRNIVWFLILSFPNFFMEYNKLISTILFLSS